MTDKAHYSRTRTLEFDLDLPAHLGCNYEGLKVTAWISPGMPGTRWEPAEPPWIEDMHVEDEYGQDISDYLARNLPAWMWLEDRCLEQGE